MRFIFIFLFLVSACKPEVKDLRRHAPQPVEQDDTAEPTAGVKRFQLNWAKAPQAVPRYQIRFGQEVGTLLETVLVVDTAQNFDPEQPAAIVSLPGERFASQKQACFQIIAENAAGASTPSDALCVTIP